MRNVFLPTLVCLAGLLTSCSKQEPKQESKFVMPIESVQKLQGFVLKGLSISGKVTKGCIARDQEYTITRNGKQILTTQVRLLNINDFPEHLDFNGEVYLGESPNFYLPDMKEGEVVAGDIVTSMTATCTLGPPRKAASVQPQ